MLEQLGKNAVQAQKYLRTASTKEKNEALTEIAKALREHMQEIIDRP